MIIKIFRYDMIGAYHYNNIKTHPQEDMNRLGFHLVESKPLPICDCWWFKCDKYPKDIPDYIDEIGEFKNDY